MLPGKRANIYKVVCIADNFKVVLHNDHSIAKVSKPLQHTYKLQSVARVETYAGLIQDVERAYKRTPDGAHQMNALTLSAGEPLYASVKSKVAKPHLADAVKPLLKLLEGQSCHLHLIRLKMKGIQKLQQGGDAHIHKLRYISSRYLHILCLPLQPAPFALRADRAALISGEHIFVLYLIALLFHHLEEWGNAGKMLCALPDKALLLL